LRLGFYLIFLLNCVVAVAQQNPDLGRFIQPVQPAKSAKEMYLNRNLSPDDVEAQLKVIEEWLREGEYALALKKSEELLKLDSTLEQPLTFAAEASRLLNDFGKAAQYIEQIKRSNPLSAAPYLIEALIAYHSGRLEEMVVYLDQAKKREPQSSYLYHYYALYHFGMGNINKAKRLGKSMLKQSKDHLAEAYRLNGLLEINSPNPNWKKAFKLLKVAAELAPTYDLTIPLAYAAYEVKEYHTCLNYLDQFHKQPATHIGPLTLKAMAHFQLNQLEQASQSLHLADSLLNTIQDLNLRIVGLKELYKEVKDLPIAEAKPFLFVWAQTMYYDHEVQYPFARRSLRDRDYCDKSKWFLLTAANHSMKKNRHALFHLQWAYKCDTLSPFLNFFVMTIYNLKEDHESAHYFLKRSIEYGLNYGEAYYLNAQYYKMEEDTAEVLSNFKKALELSPYMGLIWYEYGAYLLSIGDSVAGIEALEKCLSFNPANANPYRLLSQTLYNRSSFNRSLTAIDDAIRREPQAEDYLLRAKLRDTLGFDSNIEEDLKEALNKNADLVELQEFYIRWLADQNRKPEAITLMAQTCNQVLAWEEIMPSCASSDTALEQLEVFIQACGKVDTEAARMADFFWDQHNLLKAGEWFNQSKLRQNKLKAALCFIHEGDVDKARAITDLSFELKPEEKIWLRNIIQLKEKGLNGLERMRWNISMSPHDKVTEQLVQMVFNQLGLSPERADQLNPFK
jgi:predicted Zn-dependent protease